jgi:choline dehydrogenase-like flavoprotein
MIEDARKIPSGASLQADLCVVGGGAAAICLTLEYMKSGKSVLVIPGGGANQTAEGIDLYRGDVEPPGSHEPLEENRLRMWGGTTTVWGGRCVPFDPIDFMARPWIPESGWPLKHEDLEGYVERANRLSEAGAADFDARSVFPNRQAEIIAGMDNDEIVSWPLERWSVPTDYSKRYHKDLDEAHNVRVLLHAHAIHLQLDETGQRVEHVKTACRPGREFSVHGTVTVIACGALENARLLLASNDVAANGIGNNHDLVGRYYQSHRFGVCGHAILHHPTEGFIYDFEKDAEGVYCRRRFWLTPQAQEAHGVNNIVGFFFRTVSGESEHRNAMVSTVLLIKILLGGAKKGPARLLQILKQQRHEIADHLWIILKDFPSVFSQLMAVAYTRFVQKRRLPMVLPPRKSNHFPLFFQSEHAPSRDSRVVLEPSSRDAFGVPRLKAKIKFSEIDYRTVKTFVTLFKKRMEESGKGTFRLLEKDQDLLEHPDLRRFNSNSHNIGTTRMATRPEDGVVDTDCKVFGVDNLYVAGSSVFPTSSHANPTLLIIALAIRLADHIPRQFSASSENLLKQ